MHRVIFLFEGMQIQTNSIVLCIYQTNEWYYGLELSMEEKTGLGIVYPEISRCKHVGYRGNKIRGTLQHAFFADHKTSLTTSYTIPQEEIYR